LERREESGRDYDEAIRLDPNFFQAYFNRGINHRELGRIPEAIRDFSEALRLNPKFAPAYVDRAAIYLHQNNAGAAYADWLKVLENIDTVEVEHRPRILNDIAWWLATSPAKICRDGKTALRAAMQACELSHWTRSDVLDTLAAAYAETGDFWQRNLLGESGTAVNTGFISATRHNETAVAVVSATEAVSCIKAFVNPFFS
jgi:tetratricopeptide (TPR) repeat protein